MDNRRQRKGYIELRNMDKNLKSRKRKTNLFVRCYKCFISEWGKGTLDFISLLPTSNFT